MHATGTSMTIEAVTNVDGTVFDTLELKKPEGWGLDWHAEHGAPVASPAVCPPPLPLQFYFQVFVPTELVHAARLRNSLSLAFSTLSPLTRLRV